MTDKSRKHRFPALILALAMAGTLALSACGSAPSQPTAEANNFSRPPEQTSPAEQTTLTVAQQVDAASMDPHMCGSMTDMNVLINIYDALIGTDENGNLIPGLALEWKAVDNLTWEFKLREGVKFHNGEPFNAESVKYTVERIIDKDNPVRVVEFANVTGAVVIDEYTVQIKTSVPDALIPNKCTLFTGLMLPAGYCQEKGLDYLAEHPVGCGPYQFSSWVRDHEIVLEAYEDYWQGPAAYDKLVFKVIPNAADMSAAIRAGEIDIATNCVDADMIAVLSGDDSIKILSTPWVRTFAINIDTTAPYLDDKLVRQAINYAVDTDTVIASLYGGYAHAVPTIVPSQVFGFNPDVPRYPYDVDKAKELLRQAGYAEGEVEVAFMATNTDSAVAQAIANYLEEAGIKVDLQLVDSATLDAKRRAEAAPMYMYGNSAWTMDAWTNFQSYLPVEGSTNWQRNNDERLLELTTKATSSVDQDIRRDAFYQIQEILHEEAYFIFLWQRDTVMAVNKNVDWKPNPVGVFWMYPAKPAG